MTRPDGKHPRLTRSVAAVGALPAIFLAVEFLDELVGSVHNTAWPLIRSDLGLTYAQIGALVGLPAVLGCLLEPAIGLLGDLGRRKNLILAGGFFFILSLLLTGASAGYLMLLFATILFFPSSGAFVSLS
jgi:FSR family fosmidomycin resistance protein-like MFS transporter